MNLVCHEAIGCLNSTSYRIFLFYLDWLDGNIGLYLSKNLIFQTFGVWVEVGNGQR
jgi:hypothetical protein